MQVKTTLGKVFATWKKNNDGTDEQIIALLRTNPATYRELQSVPIGSPSSPDPYPTKQAIDSIANRRGISAIGLTGIIKSI